MADFRVIDGSIFHYQLQDWLGSRALQFGDGFFESMVFDKGQVRLAKEHAERVNEGLELMDLKSPLVKSTMAFLQDSIPALLNNETCRLKLLIWRKGSGKYAPLSTESDYALLSMPFQQGDEPVNKIEVSQRHFSAYSPFSAIKTLSSLHYVLAGKEAIENGDELILLRNHEGYLSEGLYSNVLLIREGQLYTPPLSTGCINGVVRRFLFSQNQIRMSELLFRIEDLRVSDQLLLINASGIRVVKQVGTKLLMAQEEMAEKLRDLIFR